jgi:predicted ATP-dependent protease
VTPEALEPGQLRVQCNPNDFETTLELDTLDQVVGQVDGLSVLQTGDFSFGQPSRITATARLGKGEVLDS